MELEGGGKTGASLLTNTYIYTKYIISSPLRASQVYAWKGYPPPVKNRALAARFCAWCMHTCLPLTNMQNACSNPTRFDCTLLKSTSLHLLHPLFLTYHTNQAPPAWFVPEYIPPPLANTQVPVHTPYSN